MFDLFVLFLFSLKASAGWEVLDQIREMTENEKRATTRGRRMIPNARAPKGRRHPNITQRKMTRVERVYIINSLFFAQFQRNLLKM